MIKGLIKNKKKFQKGFTLIELLVVVAIIGVLAAVGVTAYSGFTAKAKEKASRSIHAGAVKKLAAELKKCDLGETFFMVGNRYDNGANYSQRCVTNGNERTQAQRARDGMWMISSDKNPHSQSQQAILRTTGWVQGQSSIYFSGNAADASVTIRTCFVNPCGTAANRQQTTINIE